MTGTSRRIPRFFSRRQFLGKSALGAGAAMTVASLPATALAQDEDRFGGWPVGIQSYSLRKYDTAQAIRHMQGLGLHFVEFYGKHVPLNSTEEQLADLQKLLKAADVTMSAHGVNKFTKDHDKNREVFEFSKRAGLKTITANPEPDSFDSLDKLVAEYDIRVAIHNHGPDALYDKIDDVINAVKDHDERIGACVDTGHFIRSKEDPIEAIRRIGSRVYGVHIKDEDKREKKAHGVVIGKGFLDVAELFKALKEINFPTDGAISLEYESNPDNPIDDIQQCVNVAVEAIAKAA